MEGPAFAFGSRCAVPNKLKTGHSAVALGEFPGSHRTEPAHAPRRGSENHRLKASTPVQTRNFPRTPDGVDPRSSPQALLARSRALNRGADANRAANTKLGSF